MIFLGKNLKIKKNLSGELTVNSDKSITHRAFMLSSISEGESYIKNPLYSEDCINTLLALEKVGISFIKNNDFIKISGKGFKFSSFDKQINLGNSGTSMRLLTGLFSGICNLNVELSGDDSLVKRPMKRVIEPLEKMGANIISNNFYAPIKITGNKLQGINYTLNIASAQVKSAILLATLNATSETNIIEPIKTRDHTEKMLKYLGADIFIENNNIRLYPLSHTFKSRDFFIPGDISSASFFIVLGILASKNGLKIKDVGLNNTRIGFLDILKKMGAKISIENKREFSGEEIGDIIVEESYLKAIHINDKNIIPNIIDEIPILSVAMMFADGESVIENLSELRVKECDRLSAIVSEFSKYGVFVSNQNDTLIIKGQENLKYNDIKVKSFFDHRIAMCEIILSLLGNGETEIDDIDCIKTSFPDFFNCMNNVGIDL